jgi:hypothetical protein
MKTLITLILASLASLNAATAAPRIWAVDQLGGAKYKKEVVQSHPIGFGIGIFTQRDLFGDGYPVVDEAAVPRKIPLARYNLRWSDTHTFTRRDFPAIVAEAKRGLYVVNRHPNMECQFNGATEHQLNAADAIELARQVLAVIPERCIYVNNPWEGKGAFIPPGPRIINEVHGGKAQRPRVGGRYNFSFDGTDAFDANVTAIKNRLHDADVFFFWTSQNNGRRNAADSTPRPQRQFWPTGDLMRGMAHLATDEGRVRVPANYTVKPKSDQHAVPPQSRELKPVLILPPKVERVQCVGDNGKLIAVSGKAEPFADKRWRYYFPEYGYQIAQKALAIHGKPTCNLRVGGAVTGVVNMGFRAGSFR